MNAIILHGRPSKEEYYSLEHPTQSNSHWLPWLKKRLISRDIFTATPEVPLAYEPLWERWVTEIERYDITEETMLVGHSCGGGFWVRYLSEHPDIRVDKLVLVAPWIDVEQEDENKFFNFTIDHNLSSRTKELVIFHSSDDVPEIKSSVKKLREDLKNITYKEFENRGHFARRSMPDDGSFPELLSELVG